MWSGSDPQHEELLSLCQDTGEQESRVLQPAMSREGHSDAVALRALPGQGAAPGMAGRGDAPVLGEHRGGVFVGSLEHRPLGKAMAKAFPAMSRDFTCLWLL